MDCQKMLNDLLDAGLTQIEIADKAGISQPYISNILTGYRGARVGAVVAGKIYNVWSEFCGEAPPTNPNTKPQH